MSSRTNRAFLYSRKRAFSTQFSSTEFSDWGIQSKNSTFSTGSVSRKTQSKKCFTCFFNSSHRSSHHKTHTHTPTRPYQVPHTHTRYHTAVSYNSADAALAITAVPSHRKSAWCTPSSDRQQRVSHDSSSARYRCHFADNGYACCSFGGSRLSATPRTYPWRLSAEPNAANPLGRRFVAREARVAREDRAKHRAANRVSSVIQQYSLTPTVSRKSTRTIKSTRLTIRRTRRIQSKKSPVEKGRFRLAESDYCSYKKWLKHAENVDVHVARWYKNNARHTTGGLRKLHLPAIEVVWAPSPFKRVLRHPVIDTR